MLNMKWQSFKFPELLLWLCRLVDFFDLLVNGNFLPDPMVFFGRSSRRGYKEVVSGDTKLNC